MNERNFGLDQKWVWGAMFKLCDKGWIEAEWRERNRDKRTELSDDSQEKKEEKSQELCQLKQNLRACCWCLMFASSVSYSMFFCTLSLVRLFRSLLATNAIFTIFPSPSSSSVVRTSSLISSCLSLFIPASRDVVMIVSEKIKERNLVPFSFICIETTPYHLSISTGLLPLLSLPSWSCPPSFFLLHSFLWHDSLLAINGIMVKAYTDTGMNEREKSCPFAVCLTIRTMRKKKRDGGMPERNICWMRRSMTRMKELVLFAQILSLCPSSRYFLWVLL